MDALQRNGFLLIFAVKYMIVSTTPVFVQYAYSAFLLKFCNVHSRFPVTWFRIRKNFDGWIDNSAEDLYIY